MSPRLPNAHNVVPGAPALVENPGDFAKHASCLADGVTTQHASMLWTLEEISRLVSHSGHRLVLRDLESGVSLVNDAKVPIQFVFAGKAHPRDVPGTAILQEVFTLLRDARFTGKVLFIEDYDINVGRYLLNGGLNLSIPDGWWAEAYDGHNGFAIGQGETHSADRMLTDSVLKAYIPAAGGTSSEMRS